MFVTIKPSKTNPFRKGVTLALGRMHRPLCPMVAMAAYIKERGKSPGPLFHFTKGDEPLIGKKFVSKAWKVLSRTLGRWESTAYLR